MYSTVQYCHRGTRASPKLLVLLEVTPPPTDLLSNKGKTIVKSKTKREESEEVIISLLADGDKEDSQLMKAKSVAFLIF
jgi:hypothetical protein